MKERDLMFIVHNCWRDIRELKLDAEIATKRITECCEQFAAIKLESMTAARDSELRREAELRAELKNLRARLKEQKPKTARTKDVGLPG